MDGIMAYLNLQERQQLAADLVKVSAGRARGKLRRMDSNVKLAFMRNAQGADVYSTRLDLPTLGVMVTLVEDERQTQTRDDAPGSANVRLKRDLKLSQVIVDPMPENQT
jgi:hypothetical protein